LFDLRLLIIHLGIFERFLHEIEIVILKDGDNIWLYRGGNYPEGLMIFSSKNSTRQC